MLALIPDAGNGDLDLIIVCLFVQFLENSAMWQLIRVQKELLGSKRLRHFECLFSRVYSPFSRHARQILT